MAFSAHRIFVPCLTAILVCAASASAAPRRPLDRARIHALYHDGEFEKVLRELDAYGKGQCACVRDDSVFAEKHLAVVLAANPATRELGRYHMFRLLDLSPRADLLDMYVGDEVDAVFDKARKEHDLRAKDPIGKASAPAPAPRAVAAAAAPIPTALAKPGPAAPVARSAAPAPVAAAAPAPSSVAETPAYSDAWARLPPVRAEAAAHPIRVAKSDRRAKPIVAHPQAAARPHTVASPSRRGPASVQPEPYRPWDAVPAPRPAAAGALGARSAATTPPPAAVGDSALRQEPVLTEGGAQSVRPKTRAEADSARPAWKEPGLWIGGGAAVAAIAFTLWHAGSDGGGPGKTYAVPASLSK